MASKTPTSATALAEQNAEDIHEQYEKYLHAGRSFSFNQKKKRSNFFCLIFIVVANNVVKSKYN